MKEIWLTSSSVQKTLILVNPTEVEIFYHDINILYKSPNFGKSYSSMILLPRFKHIIQKL